PLVVGGDEVLPLQDAQGDLPRLGRRPRREHPPADDSRHAGGQGAGSHRLEKVPPGRLTLPHREAPPVSSHRIRNPNSPTTAVTGAGLVTGGNAAATGTHRLLPGRTTVPGLWGAVT